MKNSEISEEKIQSNSLFAKTIQTYKILFQIVNSGFYGTVTWLSKMYSIFTYTSFIFT